jgi:hypothetical protein
MKALAYILIVLGILLVIIGSLFKIMHWPDLFFGQISGTGLLIIGIFILVFKKSKKSPNKA